MKHDATTEREVARHYARGDLERIILDALAGSGKDIEHLATSDLSAVDEFHSGGRPATIELAAQMEILPDMHLLDVGCGIGGPARYFAEAHGCRVTGVDLTGDFVRTATALSRRVGLDGRTAYRQASGLDLPFEPATFDGAYMLHVGMNIADKRALFAEIRRVLKPGALFTVYDAMRTGEGELRFPVHWASTPETSHLESATAYRQALAAAGFETIKERDRGAFARQAFQEILARDATTGPPRLGPHLLMKSDVAEKIANVVQALERGIIAPIELISRARP